MKYASKSAYRAYFAEIVDYVKMAYFLRIVNIDKGNFSRFMKGADWDYLISQEKLDKLFTEIHEKIT